MKSEFSISLTEYTLEEVVSHLIDYRGKTPKKTNYGIPLVTAKIVKNGRLEPYNEFIAEKDYDSWMVRGIPKKGDIVLTVEAPLGEVAQLDDTKIALAQRIVTLRGKEDILDNTYFLYILQSSPMQSQLQSRASGTTVIGIKQSELRKIVLKLPPLPTQKKIAHILSTLDDKIELNRKMNQTLESMASAIFKSWFVDFDPVHAKAKCTNESELENAAKELGISEEILDLFPREFEESELGIIPKGWEVKKVEDVSEILNGHAFKSSDYLNDGIFVLRTKNFSNDGYVENANDDVYLPESFLESHGQFLCQPYDFHLVMVGASIGKTSMILPMNLPALRNQNMWCFRPKSELISRVFLSHTVKNVVRLQMGSASGSAREFFTKGSFFAQKVIIPKENILLKYEKITTPILEKIAINQNEIQSLQKTRDTLLTKLLSGEIDVSDLSLKME